VGFLRRPARGHRGATRIFFAADLHGSEPTFRKFLRAASFYDVDVLVFGGDLMGKALVPIVRDEAGRYRAELHGERQEMDGETALAAFTRRVEVSGHYWAVVDEEEYAELRRDRLAVKGLFDREARTRLLRWIDLARDRLAGTGVRLFLTGGNDDTEATLSALEEADGETVVSCENEVVELDGEHTMITVGYSTPTPWDTPREVGEAELGAMIEERAARVPDVSRCVFNLHAPPKDTPIDTCLMLERTAGLEPGELPRPVRRGGQPVYVGGGSTAVGDAIGRYQPVVGLHGHIHESPGRFRIGRTQCFNPGSEYAQGQLNGLIVSIRAGELASYQHTSG